MKIENVYIRVEDDVSYPGHPFSFGIVLKMLNAFTTDGKWNYSYVKDAEEIHKVVSMRNLSMFFNYSDKKEDVFVEFIRGKNDTKTFSEFAELECNRGRQNRYILNGLNLDVHLTLNKVPLKNRHPQVTLDIKIGSSFEEGSGSGKSEMGHFEINIEMEQLKVLMKLVEYAVAYGKFQKSALLAFLNRRMTQEEKDKYSTFYTAYLFALRKKNTKMMTAKKLAFEAMENEFSLITLKRIRLATRKDIDYSEGYEERKKETSERLKELEGRKSSVLALVKSCIKRINTY